LPSQTLLKQMSAKGAQASRMSVDTGPFSFHYIIEGAVCYLTLTGDPPPLHWASKRRRVGRT